MIFHGWIVACVSSMIHNRVICAPHAGLLLSAWPFADSAVTTEGFMMICKPKKGKVLLLRLLGVLSYLRCLLSQDLCGSV